MRIILFIIGTLLLINMAFLSRITNPGLGFSLQASLAITLIAYAILFHQIPKKCRKIIGILCLVPLIIALFLFTYGNRSTVDYNETVVIVLGAGINGETVSRALAHRLDAAIAYWQQNPNAYIIVCGGLGSRATITEAEAMKRYLIAHGLPETHILLEDQSTSTYENLKFAKELLEDHFPNGFQAAVITSDFHIYRAVRTARQLGLDVTHLGAYTDWYTWPANYLREILAIFSNLLLGPLFS